MQQVSSSRGRAHRLLTLSTKQDVGVEAEKTVDKCTYPATRSKSLSRHHTIIIVIIIDSHHCNHHEVIDVKTTGIDNEILSNELYLSK